jgi:hypothetical protein
MKYLTKFNEATQAEHLKAIDEISNYVDNCFIDLKDSNNYFGESVYKGTRPGIVDYKIITTPPKIEFYIFDGIEERVDKLDKLKEFYLDIENMIDKVKIKYPNLIYTLNNNKSPFNRFNKYDDINILIKF